LETSLSSQSLALVLIRTNKRQNTQITQNNTTQLALVNSTTDALKKYRLRESTVSRAWFSRLVRHRKRSSGQPIYSYNPGAHLGPVIELLQLDM